MRRLCSGTVMILLAIFLGDAQAWPQPPDPGVIKIDPLPAGAPRYQAGSRFRPATSGRGANPVTQTWRYPTRPDPEAIRRVSTMADGDVIDDGAIGPIAGEPLLEDFGGESCTSSCPDSCTGERFLARPPRTQWSGGIEFTFLKPHFEDNPAFTTLDSDGATFETFTETPFEFNRELAPRVWIEAMQCQSLGIRATYWQFDYDSRDASGSPPANGFGRVSPPPFGSVDLSTTVPNSVFAASSDLNAYAIDLEATRAFPLQAWNWLASAGLRYAEAEQRYQGNLRDADGDPQGNVTYDHLVKGIGPTLSLRTQRPFSPQWALFGLARGSLVFGDGQTNLSAVEDQDLDTQLTTRSSSDQDDLLPITEIQVGVQWTPPCPDVWHPYLHLALEGQHWAGAGNASSTEGDLGFFGFNVAVGVNW